MIDHFASGGVIPTLWHPEGIEAAWLGTRDLLRRARPNVVQLHTWQPQLVAEAVRGVLPDAQLVCGFGVDAIARDVCKLRMSVAEGVRVFLRLGERAKRVGARAIMNNAEASWKRPPNTDEKRRLSELVRNALDELHARFPEIALLHTSYDHPSYHSTYNWNDWCGPQSPTEESYFQVYAAPGDGMMAHRGALPRREARAFASFEAAVRAGWFAKDDPSTPEREGIGWRPYYQAHSVPARDTVSSALKHKRAALWAFPARADRDGRSTLLALCELERLGLWRADGLEEFQRMAGLEPDKIYGPKTERALVGTLS